MANLVFDGEDAGGEVVVCGDDNCGEEFANVVFDAEVALVPGEEGEENCVLGEKRDEI